MLLMIILGLMFAVKDFYLLPIIAIQIEVSNCWKLNQVCGEKSTTAAAFRY